MLECDLLVGRSSRSTLRIEDERVSNEHASIRWTGDHWMLRDLGSLNRTIVDGNEAPPGGSVRLVKDSTIIFGSPSQTWLVADDSAPVAMAVPEASGFEIFAIDGLLALPSTDRPEVTIYRNRQGGWVLDGEQGLSQITDRSQVVVGGVTFHVHLPLAPTGTAPVKGFVGRRVSDLFIKFRVSADLEHIELDLHGEGERQTFAARTHNEMLLILARTRKQDQAREIPEANCGWMYQDDLCRDVAMDPARLNVDVYRLRRQFATLGLLDPANIIERRTRAKQIRIGIPRIEETLIGE